MNEPEEEPEESRPKFSAAMYQEDSDEHDEYEVVTVSKTRRGLEGIVKQEGRPLKVNPLKERPVTLEVKPVRPSKTQAHHEVEDIKNVWKEQDARSYAPSENIWSGVHSRTKKTLRHFPKKSLVILGVFSVILLGTIIYVSAGSAKIDIYPKKQSLEFQLKVSASDKFSFVDAGLNKIPGQLFSIEKNASQTYLATGERDVAQKARGIITVYNEYGTTPQVLIATTRFESPEGLVFRTLKAVTVPGTKVENGKIIPGSIKVEVIADKPGDTYNIPPAKFTIPAFNERGDAGRYEKIYGRSDEAMKGGIVGKAKVVTETDFNTAKQALSDQVRKELEESLKTQLSGLKSIYPSAIQLKEPESTARIDEAADEFMMAVSGSIKTVGFKEEDLKGLIKQFVDKTKNLTVIPDKLTISYSDITFDPITGVLSFTVDVKTTGYAKVDSDKIITDLAGKNEEEIKNYLKGLAGIDTAKVVLSPFWVKKMPQDKERIKIQIHY